MNDLIKYFLRGLFVVVPVVATLAVVAVIFDKLNHMVFTPIGELLPAKLDGEHFLQRIPYRNILGMVSTILLIMGIGVLTSNILGRQLLARLEQVVNKLPLIKLLYSSIKDLLGAFVGDKKSFDKPVSVSLTGDPHTRVIGFITQDDLGRFGLADHVAVYLPQSYNFAGNLILVPRDRVQVIDRQSSEVMKFLVSGGVSAEEN